MAESFNIDAKIDWRQEFDPTASGRPTISSQLLKAAMALAFGTSGANKFDKLFDEYRSLTSGSGQNYDLAGGLTARDGSTITFARLRFIGIVSYATVDGRTLLVGAGSNPLATWVGAAGDLVKVTAGGFLLIGAPLATGYVVTGGTGDVLRVEASGGDVTYDIVLAGCSA